MGRKAILVVSFGTSHLDTKRRTIDRMVEEISQVYREYIIYQAFTSKIIIHQLKEKHQLTIFTVEEAFQQMKDDGVEEVIVQPTHILNGIENQLMLNEVRRQRKAFTVLKVGSPLLTDTQDYFDVLEGIMKELPTVKENEAILMMGHGSEHYINASYSACNDILQSKGYKDAFIAAVEAYPYLGDIIKRMRKKSYEKIYLTPFMIVAGEHAKNDMLGEKESSWISILRKEGYCVEPIVKGLGEYSFISKVFIQHIEKAVPLTCVSDKEGN